MYKLELFDRNGNVIREVWVNSEAEAEYYGRQHQELMEITSYPINNHHDRRKEY